MALQPHQRLGPYEILSAVGAGGMAEVYTAQGATWAPFAGAHKEAWQ